MKTSNAEDTTSTGILNVLVEQGHREILGVDLESSEAETDWRKFLESPSERGFTGVKLITSDNHAGLRMRYRQYCKQSCGSAASSIWSKTHGTKRPKTRFARRSPMQCVFITRKWLNRPGPLPKRLWISSAKRHRFSAWLEPNYEDGLTFLAFRPEAWKKIRTSNCLERLNKEIRRQTRVAGIFPNDASCLRLVSAMLMEQNDEWINEKAYLNLKALEKVKK